MDEGFMRINFCQTLNRQKSSSIFLNPASNLSLTRGVTVDGPKWFVLCVRWRDRAGANCEMSLAFDTEINFAIHRNIFVSFLKNWLKFRNLKKAEQELTKAVVVSRNHRDRERELMELEKTVIESCANDYNGKTPTRLDLNMDVEEFYKVHEIHFIEKKEPDAPAAETNRKSLKTCIRKLFSFK